MDQLLNHWSNWIERQVRPSGAICDPYSRHPLPFQYHYAAYLLGRLCADAPELSDPTASRVWHYFCQLSPEQTRSSREFNGFLLSLAHWVARRRESQWAAELADYLTATPLPTASSLRTRNRNFAFMLDFELRYRCSHLHADTEPKLRVELDEMLADSIGSDGLYVDSPSPNGGGYASSVYVAKMALTRLLGAMINGRAHQIEEAGRAIDALLSLADIDRVFSYGRSQSSLFGYANLYAACRLLALQTTNAQYRRAANEIEEMLESWQSESGELALNPSANNHRRLGFDQYMHAIVYNIYSWAIVHVSIYIAKINGRENQSMTKRPSGNKDTMQTVNKVQYHPAAGILRYRSAAYDCLIAMRRFNDEPKLGRDQRYQCATPQLIRHRKRDVVPPIPRDIRGFMRLAQRQSLLERFIASWQAARFLFSRTNSDDFLDRAGFSPFIRLDRFRKICAGDQQQLTFEQSCDRVELTSEFSFNADVDRRTPWRKMRCRRTKTSSIGTLSTRITFEPTALTFRHRVMLDHLARRQADLIHLNLRLQEAPVQCAPIDGWSHFEFASGLRIRHHPAAGDIAETTCNGSTGPVIYLRAASRVTSDTEFDIQTILSFAEPGNSP